MTHNPSWVVPVLTILTICTFTVAIVLVMTQKRSIKIFGKYTIPILAACLIAYAVFAILKR